MRKKLAVCAAVLILVPAAFAGYENRSACDRDCLVNLMKDYLAALVAHNPEAVPFDRYVKFTENTAEIPVGYGLRETASGGPTGFQVYAADPVNQQVACLVMMQEHGHDDISLSRQQDQNRAAEGNPGFGERALLPGALQYTGHSLFQNQERQDLRHRGDRAGSPLRDKDRLGIERIRLGDVNRTHPLPGARAVPYESGE
jgi:hypothetical protein